MAVVNCTLGDNRAPDGRAVACEAGRGGFSTLSVRNAILWNGGNEVWKDDKATVTIAYSDLTGGWAGPGEDNNDTDPLFTAAGAWNDGGTPDDPADDTWAPGDYHLQVDSPCRDAGDPAFVPRLGDTDIDGERRVMDCRVDMGADEVAGLVHMFDADGDCRVTLFDFAGPGGFVACMTGPKESLAFAGGPARGCFVHDADDDGDVDILDFLGFLRGLTGP